MLMLMMLMMQANPAGEDVDARVKRLVEVDYKPCIQKIEPDDSEWATSMDSCRRSVSGQWKTSRAGRFVLDERLDKVEEEHIKRSVCRSACPRVPVQQKRTAWLVTQELKWRKIILIHMFTPT